MPELSEQMYCHQQICIPPIFPYLLRQYAKAAIRSQPTDLLKWSTAYFRCLSLNIPPPVKPRLEYPIPRDYIGITPGWLRALNYQLQNNQTVPFKILWDRWVGSCLQHDTLIKILCLGGFTDHMAIPWNRFLGLCAAHLTDSLTQSMVLICEILTEEPEGGSAMIPLETFLDIYKFLAAIDASQPQTLINVYFTDSALNLYEKEKKKVLKEVSAEELGSVESSTATPEEVAEEQEFEIMELGEGSIVSCPDIVSDDALQEPELDEEARAKPSESEEIVALKRDDQAFGEDEEDENGSLGDREEDSKLIAEGSNLTEETSSKLLKKVPTLPDVDSRVDVEFQEEVKEEKEEKADGGSKASLDEEGSVEVSLKSDKDEEDEDAEDQVKEDEGRSKDDVDKDEDDELKEDDEEATAVDHLKTVEQDILEKGGIEIDEEQQEAEEVEIEESKISQLYALPLPAQEEAEEIHGEGDFYQGIDELEEHIKVKYKDISVDDELEEALEEEETPEEIQVDAIPGIGPVVPENLVDAVVRYLTEVSAEEHGMTMPRHVRHYTCPPLEVYQ